MYDREHFYAIVIGGGPAGAQCALWLKHMGVPVLLIEQGMSLGGTQRVVPNPLSNHYVVSSSGVRAQQIASAIHENLSRHGVPHLVNAQLTFEPAAAGADWFHLQAATPHGVHEVWAKHLVLATGTQFKTNGFTPSDTLFIGSADPRIRSGNAFEGRRVAILGGGDNAMETHAFIARQNPSWLRVFARTIRASKALLAAVPAADIERAPLGYDVFVAQGPGAHGYTLACCDDPFTKFAFDALIVQHGVEARKVLPDALDPQRNEKGFIAVNDACVTSNPRILAVGEATHRMHPCVATAMADGVVAAKTLEARFKLESAERP